MALLLARRQDPPRPFYHPNKLNQLGEDVRAQIRDQLDQRWHPVVQATFFTYMMKRMDDFGLSKKLKVPGNYWRLDVCRIWLHKMTVGLSERKYEDLTGIPKSTINKLFLYAELMVSVAYAHPYDISHPSHVLKAEGFHEPFFSTGNLKYRQDLSSAHLFGPLRGVATAVLDGVDFKSDADSSRIPVYDPSDELEGDLCVAEGSDDLASRSELRQAGLKDLDLRTLGAQERFSLRYLRAYLLQPGNMFTYCIQSGSMAQSVDFSSQRKRHRASTHRSETNFLFLVFFCLPTATDWPASKSASLLCS